MLSNLQAAEDEDSHSTSGPDDDEDPSSGYLVPNGRPSGAGHEKSRSTSSTVHDRSKNGPNFHTIPTNSQNNSSAPSSSILSNSYSQGQHQSHPSSASSVAASRAYPASHLTSPSSPFAHNPYGSQGGQGGGGAGNVSRDSNNPHSAKESFLNYFFGGADPHLSGPASVGAHPGRIVGQSPMSGGGNGQGRENPLHGRKGLEGNAAAFEMKSLEKHLEPVCSFFRLPVSSLFGSGKRKLTFPSWLTVRHLLSNTRENLLD